MANKNLKRYSNSDIEEESLRRGIVLTEDTTRSDVLGSITEDEMNTHGLIKKDDALEHAYFCVYDYCHKEKLSFLAALGGVSTDSLTATEMEKLENILRQVETLIDLA